MFVPIRYSWFLEKVREAKILHNIWRNMHVFIFIKFTKNQWQTWEVDEYIPMGYVDGVVVANPITSKAAKELTGHMEITLKPIQNFKNISSSRMQC